MPIDVLASEQMFHAQGASMAAIVSVDATYADESTHVLTTSQPFPFREVETFTPSIVFADDISTGDPRFMALAFAKEFFTLQALLASAKYADEVFPAIYGSTNQSATVTTSDGGDPTLEGKLAIILQALTDTSSENPIWVGLDNLPYISVAPLAARLDLIYQIEGNMSPEKMVCIWMSDKANAFRNALVKDDTRATAPEVFGNGTSVTTEQLVRHILVDNASTFVKEIFPQLKTSYEPTS